MNVVCNSFEGPAYATAMKKLYRYNDDERCYYYDEAWVADGQVIEHVGKLGTRGRTRYHELDPAQSEEENILRVLQPGLRGGYREIAAEDHQVLIIEYVLQGWGSPVDLEKRHKVQQRMDETLGWTGLGHCDGGSIGSGTMEVCCIVVDFDLAERIITHDLVGTDLGDFSRIYRCEGGNESSS